MKWAFPSRPPRQDSGEPISRRSYAPDRLRARCACEFPTRTGARFTSGARRTAAILGSVAPKIEISRLLSLARLHQLAGFGEAKPLESLGRESKGRHYRE